jgi:hypothetical protein
MHELAITSGLAAAYRLGADFPHLGNNECVRLFRLYLWLCHVRGLVKNSYMHFEFGSYDLLRGMWIRTAPQRDNHGRDGFDLSFFNGSGTCPARVSDCERKKQLEVEGRFRVGTEPLLHNRRIYTIQVRESITFPQSIMSTWDGHIKKREVCNRERRGWEEVAQKCPMRCYMNKPPWWRQVQT